MPDSSASAEALSANTPDLTEGFRVVAIGGGTGLSTLLRGLKRHVAAPPGSTPAANPDPSCDQPPCQIADLAAVVTVSDDGGSSGRLRKDLKMLAPGDLRNCLVALSEDSHLLSQLFQYRFTTGEGLEGHSFGNLFLAALSGITGDLAQAVHTSSQILATRGRIYPATRENVTLAARMADGSVVSGETNITASRKRVVQLMMEPAGAKPLPETLEAIARADLITMGPGSLYTSLVTNLLVDGIAEAIANASAARVYICNVMTQANESLDLTASQHLEKITEHARHVGVTRKLFDYALVNTAPISAEVAQRYAVSGQMPVPVDLEAIRALGVEPITGNFIFEHGLLRHNYDVVADELLKLVRQHKLSS
jgi:uncharacterized cofD-like protein